MSEGVVLVLQRPRNPIWFQRNKETPFTRLDVFQSGFSRGRNLQNESFYIDRQTDRDRGADKDSEI